MTRYIFNWSLAGSTIIEADILEDAQKKFDAIPAVELEEENELEFVQHEVGVETAPGIFDYDLTSPSPA